MKRKCKLYSLRDSQNSALSNIFMEAFEGTAIESQPTQTESLVPLHGRHICHMAPWSKRPFSFSRPTGCNCSFISPHSARSRLISFNHDGFPHYVSIKRSQPHSSRQKSFASGIVDILSYRALLPYS